MKRKMFYAQCFVMWPNVQPLLVKHLRFCCTIIVWLFGHVTSQNIAWQAEFLQQCFGKTSKTFYACTKQKMFYGQCFVMWPNGQTLCFTSKSQMFVKQFWIVRQGPNFYRLSFMFLLPLGHLFRMKHRNSLLYVLVGILCDKHNPFTITFWLFTVFLVQLDRQRLLELCDKKHVQEAKSFYLIIFPEFYTEK